MIIHCDSVRYIGEVLEGQEYSFLFKDLTVLDIGCNIGAFTLWIYPFVSRIWAVDMEQSHIDNLSKTKRDNGLDNLTIIRERVGIDGTLAQLMSGHAINNIDVLKLDVEGDELAIVNSPDFPTDRIATIIGEHHYNGFQLNEFQDRLQKLGYRYTEYPNNHFKAVRI